ncbi:MAG: gamma-glutamylcyclotransferase [Proteobacteria bacterium]|nr:gamma-glutamylcyclotransferase [Pseudomonadota bacterium]
MPLYFAFGSNLDIDQMARRCPGSRPLFPARLDRHRIAFTHYSRRWRGGAADALPAADRQVWGAVYALDETHFERLDAYETGYERIELDVVSTSGTSYAATSYRVLRKSELRPSRVYLDKMLRWGEHWGLPAAYLRELREIVPCDVEEGD